MTFPESIPPCKEDQNTAASCAPTANDGFPTSAVSGFAYSHVSQSILLKMILIFKLITIRSDHHIILTMHQHSMLRDILNAIIMTTKMTHQTLMIFFLLNQGYVQMITIMLTDSSMIMKKLKDNKVRLHPRYKSSSTI
jgi:hypothetical protein